MASAAKRKDGKEEERREWRRVVVVVIVARVFDEFSNSKKKWSRIRLNFREQERKMRKTRKGGEKRARAKGNGSIFMVS